MSEAETLLHFSNDEGEKEIKVNCRKLVCIGASAPFDHPHIFLDMGNDRQIVCPYCATVFVCDI